MDKVDANDTHQVGPDEGFRYFYKVTSATDPTIGDAGGRLFRWDPNTRTVTTEILSFE